MTWVDINVISLSPTAIYISMITIGLNLYFQFSGYTDIAIGFSNTLGYRVMENFNWPFFKKNISNTIIENQTNINLSNHAKGIYLINLIINNRLEVHKLIIQ